MSAKYPKDLAKHVHAVVGASARDLLPPPQTLQVLFEQLYFASLQQEEGEDVTCRVAFIDRQNPDPKPPERVVKERWQYHPLSTDLEFTTRNLVKLSKSCGSMGLDLGGRRE
jgi:hypothetical protein